jgi:hypothetical protein
LYVSSEQDSDIQGCRHDDHFRAQPFLLEVTVVSGDEERHCSDGNRREADFDVFTVGSRGRKDQYGRRDYRA